jgi:tRNA (guanine37-N1)-methyltransferase
VSVRIEVLTIFPELFEPFVRTSLLGAAREAGRVSVEVHDLRRWARDRHRSVDDIPYGGGPGMVMKPEPLVDAIEALAGPKGPGRTALVILLSPQGFPFRQERASALAGEAHLVLVCGRYEGVDQRVSELAVDLELSTGDYVLCGGEVPAMAVIEAVVRLLPGVLGNPASVEAESFGTASLEGPQYTRPAVFRGLEVPAVLRSGHHAEIARWRAEQALEWTRRRRPDLLGGRREER